MNTRRVYLTGKARSVLANRLQKFDGQYLFPQNDIDGQETAADTGTLRLATATPLKFEVRIYDCRDAFCVAGAGKGDGFNPDNEGL